MKKLLKIFLVLFLTGVGLLAVLTLVLKWAYPPEKVKALLEKELTARLHREVRLGDVSIGVLSGLTVKDFKLSESPNFGRGTFISSDKFSIRLHLLPLLSKKIMIRDLMLV